MSASCCFRQLLAVLAFAICTPLASAQSLGTTFSDLWWNPAESGWGVTIDHQQDVMFLTFFIYRADGSPYWVTALLNRVSGETLPFVFTGSVYENSGPYFGGAFNPSQVGAQQVGTATFITPQVNSAILTYSINGVTVTKSLQRQTLRNLDFSGVFNGSLNYQLSGCALAGQQIVLGGQITVLQNGAEFQMLFQPIGTSVNCGFVGTYSQTGSIGAVTGNLTCSDGSSGTFSLSGLQWTIFGMSASVSAHESDGCSLAGFIGGTGIH